MDNRWQTVGARRERPLWDEYLRRLAADVLEPVRLEPVRGLERAGPNRSAPRLRWPGR